jgi:hypothetical protein
MLSILKTSLFSATLLCLTSTAFSASIEEHTPNEKGIRIVAVDPTPEPNEVKTKIQFPEDYSVKKSMPIKGQFMLSGFPLGVDSDFPRKQEIYNDPEGQSLHIFIDNQPYFPVNEALIDALDDFENYYDQTASFEIPFQLQPGMHVIRAFPARSFNESLKDSGCFVASIFYYKDKKNNPEVDLSAPYLTYNEPQGEYKMNSKNPQPILLDFYVTNCELSRDGYKVKLTIDNGNQRTLTSWQPYYIYGLNKGVHKIRLQLMNPQNKPVPGMFNDVQRTIVIK